MFYHTVVLQKDADQIGSSADPDQTDHAVLIKSCDKISSMMPKY